MKMKKFTVLTWMRFAICMSLWLHRFDISIVYPIYWYIYNICVHISRAHPWEMKKLYSNHYVHLSVFLFMYTLSFKNSKTFFKRTPTSYTDWGWRKNDFLDFEVKVHSQSDPSLGMALPDYVLNIFVPYSVYKSSRWLICLISVISVTTPYLSWKSLGFWGYCDPSVLLIEPKVWRYVAKKFV